MSIKANAASAKQRVLMGFIMFAHFVQRNVAAGFEVTLWDEKPLASREGLSPFCRSDHLLGSSPELHCTPTAEA